MNEQTTTHPNFTATVTAHEDASGKLLMVRIAAPEGERSQEDPAEIAVIIDRSGSMSGEKLTIATNAVARLIRSLRESDRVAVVAYDDHVRVVSPLTAPTEQLAHEVEAIEAGSSTALYDGWLQGAKLLKTGGRAILLSDGLANVGRYQDATTLAAHAGHSYRNFGITTTTIGVGADYDEAVMAGMAREGGGAHYFAHTAEAICDAFSQERFAIGAIALERVSLRYSGNTVQLGHIWAGETKAAVIRIRDLYAEPATLRFTSRGESMPITVGLTMPSQFGHSDLVTLEWLFVRVAEVEDSALQVRDPRGAREVRDRVREVMMSLLSHPLADTDQTRAVVSRLQMRMRNLEQLERQYDERHASVTRKQAMQGAYNVRNRAKAYSSFIEDRNAISQLSASAMAAPTAQAAVIDPKAFLLAPAERWRSWEALPTRYDGRTLRVILVNPKDGFKVHEIEHELGVRVRPEFRTVTREEILEGIDQLESALR